MAKRGKKLPEETFIPVTIRLDDDGITVYTDSNGTDLAWRLRGGGVVDLRINPPFLALSPCPYCGVENDKGHIPECHIHSYLGKPI